MLLYCTTNRDLEVWHLDLVGALARPPACPAVYALVSFEGAHPRYYVGSSRRFTARLSAHFSFARSTKLRGHSAGGRLLAPVVARRRRALVIVLETAPGATTATLQRVEQAWLIAAARACGAAALPYQAPVLRSPERGPHAPATLAERRPWPAPWVAALAGFFREPRSATPPSPPGRARRTKGSAPTAATKTSARRRTTAGSPPHDAAPGR